MATIKYKVRLFSEWHCSSGLSEGSGSDLLVIKDEFQLPYIPGKTLKGLIRDSAEMLRELESLSSDTFLDRVFGREAESQGSCHFSNAELSHSTKQGIRKLHADNRTSLAEYLYRTKASTAIDKNGVAVAHSLRKIESVIPLSLTASIDGVSDSDVEDIVKCIRLVKRIGLSRNRGFGRCDMIVMEGGVE